jgi:hypothetical protein
MNARRVVAVVAVAVVAVVGAAGCSRGAGDANDLAVAAEADARAVVDDALAVLARGDVDVVVGRFCDQSDSGRALALDIIGKAKGRSDVQIVRSEPAWKGAEPFFYVEVKSSDGAFVHGFGVRVRDGCLDRAVGATVLPDARSVRGP